MDDNTGMADALQNTSDTPEVLPHKNESQEPPGKRILYVITKAAWGGAQRYVYDIATAMKDAGHQVTVAYGEEGPLSAYLSQAGIRSIVVPSLQRTISLKEELHALRTLITLIKEERPDLIHVNSSKAGLAIVAARLARVPRIIFTAHGWAFNEARPLWQRLIFRVIYALTVLLADRTICVSEAVRRDMRFVPFARTTVIYNGVDAEKQISREEARARLWPGNPDGTWIGMTAELHPTKRVEDAIAAVAELSPQYPDIRLVVMGDGELREWLERVIHHYHLEEKVRLAGFIPEAARHLSAFDIFVLTSRSEALAYALVEAGYAGLPTVATRVGGIPEVVRHKKTGLLVPSLNPHALARALRALLDDKEIAATYGSALKEHVIALFSRKRMLEETVALYNL